MYTVYIRWTPSLCGESFVQFSLLRFLRVSFSYQNMICFIYQYSKCYVLVSVNFKISKISKLMALYNHPFLSDLICVPDY